MHGLWLVVFVCVLGFVLRSIPVASLAAVLVYTGYKLVNLKDVKNLLKYGWGEVAIYFATMIGIVATDLLTGVLDRHRPVGRQAALHVLAVGNGTLHRTAIPTARCSRWSARRRSCGCRKLAAALDKVPESAELHVDFEQLDYIDHACLDLLMNWAKQHEATGGRLVIDWDSLHANFRGESPALEQVGRLIEVDRQFIVLGWAVLVPPTPPLSFPASRQHRRW